jgi:dinuclear metal center YbgI/SA1388 family protein
MEQAHGVPSPAVSSTVSRVLSAVGEIAPSSKAAAWDQVGLQVGDPAAGVAAIGVCHDVTPEVVDAAASIGIDLLIAYHPLLFTAHHSFVAGPGPEGRAFQLARAGVALAVVHTAFDVAPGGTADALATACGLRDVSGLGPMWPAGSVKVVTFVPEDAADAVAEAMASAGGGQIGRYSACSFRGPGVGAFTAPADASPAVGTAGSANREPETRLEMIVPASRRDAVVAALAVAHPYEEPAYDVYATESNAGFVGRMGALGSAIPLRQFANRVGASLEADVRYAGDGDAEVLRVAVVPGSGSSLIADAAAVADVLVTGDVSHHRARDAVDRGLGVIDAGHVPTERPGIMALYAAIEARFDTVHDLTEHDPNPWRQH